MAGAAAALLAGLGLAACAPNPNEGITIGLITKQEENSYWVTMREVSERTARDEGVTLLAETGSSDVDVAGQRAAFEEMLAQGVDGIMIAPTDSVALNDLIGQARADGVVVIAVDTPVEPMGISDAYFGTDNFEAGRLVGEYARAGAEALGLPPTAILLDLAPGITSGDERAAGFAAGFETGGSATILDSQTTEGNRALAAAATATMLDSHPDVTVIYAVNEEAALGALDTLAERNIDPSQRVLVTVDGGCAAMCDGVRPGQIAATAMQFPENTAREGIHAIIDAVHGAGAPSGFLNTGVQLVSGSPVDGVDSRNVEFGIRNCWGN